MCSRPTNPGAAGVTAALAGTSLADEVPEELPYGATGAAADGRGGAYGNGIGHAGAAPRPTAPRGPATRHGALRERCQDVLGDLFPPVYQYLSGARQAMADEKEVRRTLLSLVGRDRVNDCMCVDELIFIEQMS